MKVAIITVFRNTNYGAVLQAYALSTFISEKINSEVLLVDYIKNNTTNLMHNGIIYYGIHNKKTINLKSIKKCIKTLINYKGTLKRTKNFSDFINKYLKITKTKYYETDYIDLSGYQLILLGSDQIWNPDIMGGFHDAYFGRVNAPDARIVAYAPSLGKKSFTDDEIDELKEKLSLINNISVREEQSVEFLKKITKREVNCVLDPVFLISEKKWQNLELKPNILFSKYILIYSLSMDIELINEAKKLSEEINGELIMIGNGGGPSFKGITYYRDAGPREFLYLINHAEYIFTDSFHGTAFSIIFRKQFLGKAKGEKGQRLENIVNKINIKNRVFHSIKGKDIKCLIDYDGVNNILNDLKNHSISYLDFSINSLVQINK